MDFKFFFFFFFGGGGRSTPPPPLLGTGLVFLFLFSFPTPFFSWLSSYFCFSPSLTVLSPAFPSYLFSSSSYPLSSAPIPSSSSASWIRSFFVFSSSVGSIFLPLSFPFLSLPSPDFSYSFGPFFIALLLSFRFFLFVSFAMFYLAYHLLVEFLHSVVSFSFLFFRPPFCIPPLF